MPDRLLTRRIAGQAFPPKRGKNKVFLVFDPLCRPPTGLMLASPPMGGEKADFFYFQPEGTLTRDIIYLSLRGRMLLFRKPGAVTHRRVRW
jgi:hypothetical protein